VGVAVVMISVRGVPLALAELVFDAEFDPTS
jgi:hypothetical protein